MRRKLLEGLLLKKSLLPNDYQEVEYIESTGTQYIDSGYIINTPISAEYSFMITGNVANGYAIGGIYNYNNDLYIGIVRSANSKLSYRYKDTFYPSSTTITQNIKYSAMVNLEVGNQNLLLNGIQEVNSTNTDLLTNNLSCYIFAINGAPNVSKMVGRIYSCKIYNGTTLVRDFIPCYRKQDNVIGLFDLVNKVFYTNAGSGTFTKGSNIE